MTVVPPDARAEQRGISIRGVGKQFGAPDATRRVLQGIDLDIRAGEFVSVVGPSGCGKSTLLRIVAGLIDADEGTVIVDGAPAKAATRSKTIGFVPQQPALLPWRTVLDNVTLPLRVNRAGNAGRKLIDPAHVLGRLGLGDALDRYPEQLSGGMQQRVAIARAVVYDPGVLLMDEPFSALDEITRSEQRAALLRFWQSNQRTVLFVTHSVSEAILLSDRIAVMGARPGRITEIFDVDLPRPRAESMFVGDRYRELDVEVRASLRRAMGRAADDE